MTLISKYYNFKLLLLWLYFRLLTLFSKYNNFNLVILDLFINLFIILCGTKNVIIRVWKIWWKFSFLSELNIYIFCLSKCKLLQRFIVNYFNYYFKWKNRKKETKKKLQYRILFWITDLNTKLSIWTFILPCKSTPVWKTVSSAHCTDRIPTWTRLARQPGSCSLASCRFNLKTTSRQYRCMLSRCLGTWTGFLIGRTSGNSKTVLNMVVSTSQSHLALFPGHL